MSLQDITLKNEYRSLIDNVAAEFFIPALSESIEYKRAVGFFSSSVLLEISKGLSALVQNGGKIQLVASPYLSDEDIAAIKVGYAQREILVKESVLRELNSPKNEFESERLNLLANLISQGVLDIKIAFVEDRSKMGMYHEKMGIIADAQGNKIAFSGSMNESATALTANYEAIDVFCSWNGDEERVKIKENAFAAIWNDSEPNIKIIDFPELSDEIIKRYKRGKPNFKIDSIDPSCKANPEAQAVEDNANLPKIPDSCKLYDYQLNAIDSWKQKNYKGIYDMATGAGKTFTGLGSIVNLSDALNGELAVIIVCPYQHLVEQWVEDIVKFNIRPIIGYSSSPQKDWKQRLAKAIRYQKISREKRFFCFICTNATFSSQTVQSSIEKIKSQILLVVDEAHNFGAKSYLKLLDDKYRYRLGLSATLERHRDDEGTAALFDFFGEKCITYTLEQAINDGKLTPYKYYPVLVYLTPDELERYEEISKQMQDHLRKDKNGNYKLDSYGELLAMKRARIVAAASEKLVKLREVIAPYSDKHFLLVYCGAANVIDPNSDVSSTDEADIRQIEAVTSILGNEFDMKVARFTSQENMDERNAIKEHFKSGDDLQAIVAIKCLDEGVNIPGISTAFILASTTNPKEYIQRRGRVLRKSQGKEYAEIYDFVTLPRPLDTVSGLTLEQANRDVSLVKNEMTRVKEFARLAMNSMESNDIIWEVCDTYNLPYNFENNTNEED
ncbi:MAG: DEAD/DEAH box helicase family protein [Lachnospiraceae bacterium]|nr:DEAD/DEAH box helicase family protein [Ruminococcus sp.]MCM1273787.1 DEAD/DEAH box helicase family protein [Lachnospiraceae bacterium]